MSMMDLYGEWLRSPRHKAAQKRAKKRRKRKKRKPKTLVHSVCQGGGMSGK